MYIQILDGEEGQKNSSKPYLESFKVWYETWSEEYSALDPDFKLHSDNFSRQEKVLAIFLNGECAALTYFRDVDLSTVLGRKDSYFADWPEAVLDQLCSRNARVLVCSAFTVAKSFRKQKIADVSIADLLAAASIHYFKQTNAELMVGNMRNSRGANHVVYKFGAEKLITIECKSELSDLVAFDKKRLPNFPENVNQLVLQMWAPEWPESKQAA